LSFTFESTVGYYWRRLKPKQREEAVAYRRLRKFPKHSPPHFESEGEARYLISAACFEHAHVIGRSHARMTDTEQALLKVCEEFSSEIYAWCILPNHYHVLLKTAQLKSLLKENGLFHGRTSFIWNGEDDTRGRQVWFRSFERKMRSARHFFASVNYVLHNPVHHGYVEPRTDWEWSNAKQYLENMGRERTAEIWREYPILNYGMHSDKF
jgi:putative transposase